MNTIFCQPITIASVHFSIFNIMLKGLASDLSGAGDVCHVIHDFSKCLANQYLLPNESIMFSMQSIKEEFTFTNHALLKIGGSNSTTTRKLTERFDYRHETITLVQFETAGLVDRDCEIKFHIGGKSMSIDIAKAEQTDAQDFYKVLEMLSRRQMENNRAWDHGCMALKYSSEALYLTENSGQTLIKQTDEASYWIEELYKRTHPLCYREVITGAFQELKLYDKIGSMLKGLTKDLTGTADICHTAKDLSKLHATSYLLPGEEIMFAFESGKEEFAFTNEALIMTSGESATTTRKLVQRASYRDSIISNVLFETTGRVDRDCEIKFLIGDIDVSIDIARKEEDFVKGFYETLLLLSRAQKSRARSWEQAEKGLDKAADSFKIRDGHNLVSLASDVAAWLDNAYNQRNSRCYREVIATAMAQVVAEDKNTSTWGLGKQAKAWRKRKPQKEEMLPDVYFELVDKATRLPLPDTSVDAVTDLPDHASVIRFRDAVLRKCPNSLTNVDAANLRVYANRAVYDDKDGKPLKVSAKVDDLGKDEDLALIVEVPQRETPHLAREELLSRVFASMQHRFILFLSPAASGKTSLLSLFARRYPDLNCIPVSFLRSQVSAVDQLRSCGIDIYDSTMNLSSHQNHVVMIDDAQAKYDDKDFWATLIKVAPSWLPDNVRFIICATHALECGVESPVELQSLLKFGRSDFLLSDEEVQEFLVLPLTTGLPDRMKKQSFIQLLIRECSGLIGALRITPTSCAADEDNRCIVTLKKAGIIVEDVDQLVRFSSPLAEKYYSKCLFPNRALANPSSLRELITRIVGNMSASALRQSVVGETNFPKEAIFQHQFMEGLALNTHRTCLICPELSRVFPSSPADSDQPLRIEGKIDFYLNGSLRWGLELLVNGDNIGEHMARFASDGKYAALAVNDYAVIDLRGNKTGKVTGVSCMEKRVMVFFQLRDFSRCHCIFGMDKAIYDIQLKR
ncbi:putative bacterial Pleckstrin domain, P-loop containing nucleoside triphosphate hydrolase [Plasmopara halstedii]